MSKTWQSVDFDVIYFDIRYKSYTLCKVFSYMWDLSDMLQRVFTVSLMDVVS